jgi:hypothetical protein
MIIQGIAMWAAVNTPNTRFDPMYCIDLIVTEEVAAQAKKDGLKPKKKEEGWVLKFKRKLYKKDGSENPKPVVMDAHKNEYTGTIGNGSLVNVQYKFFEWKNNFGAGKGVDLQGVQVLELVPFKTEGDEFEEVDGFTSSAPTEIKSPVPSAVKTTDEFDDDIEF